jgi:ABC-2 type transport system permease protein
MLSFPLSGVLGRAGLAIVRRDYLITRSYRLAFALDGFYGILSLAVYFFISRTFSDASAADLGGAPTYFAFASVGIALGLVIDAASTGLAQRLREEQLTGTLEALVAQPLTATQICLGLVGFPFAFAMARALVYLAVAAVWMDLDVSQASWIGLILVLAVTGAALAALGVVAGAVVLVLKRGDILTGVTVFAMTLLGGAFFPISVLPDWLEPIGKVVPVRFAFEGVRGALFQGSDWGADALVLLGFSCVGLPICVWIFGRALDLGKRSGSLGQY